MFKLGKLTDYGTVLMTALTRAGQCVLTTQELATRTRISLPTVAKLLKQLAHAGLVNSTRGAHGGYQLARPASDITVADIVAALEGPLSLTECSTHGSGCVIEAHCATRANWQLINTAIREALESVTLEQMAAPLKRTPASSSSHRTEPHEFPLIRA